MKTLLIAVKSCHNYEDRMNAIRATWAKDVEAKFPVSLDLRFFIGRGTKLNFLPKDTVQLDVLDTYQGLSEKVREINRWALDREYQHVFFCDDDTYVQIDRLLTSHPWMDGEYVGRKRGPCGGFPAPYASGFSYFVNQHCMRILAEAPDPDDPSEDRWTGNTLLRAGVLCTADYRFRVVKAARATVAGKEGPLRGNDVISAAEFSPPGMAEMHRLWMEGRSVFGSAMKQPAPTSDPLGSVCVLIKTFLRDGFLFQCIQGIRDNLPGVKIVIVDDGYEERKKVAFYMELRDQGHVVEWLPFDSGFGAKANEAMRHCDREFVLIGSDDFDFSHPNVQRDVRNMVRVMRAKSGLVFLSGRVNHVEYEARWEFIAPDFIAEHHGYTGEGYHEDLTFHCCDLTVNYGLGRRSLFDKVRWDEDPEVKIGGGEHSSFFLDIKRLRDQSMLGYEVAYLDGANINEIRPRVASLMQHKDYGRMRSRAGKPGRKFLKQRGINRYRLFNGQVEES